MPPKSRKRPTTLTPTTARTVSIATLAAFYLQCKRASPAASLVMSTNTWCTTVR